MKRIDVHNHLLPGIDDGCKTMEESLACATALASAGYATVFCTPHVWPSLWQQTGPFINERIANLQRAIDSSGVSLKLLPGSELNLHPKVMETSPEHLISYSLAGRFILVDMWADRIPNWFEAAIRWLQQMKLTVILAHPERMRAVQDDPGLCDYFDHLGILLQGNLQCFADPLGSHTRRVAEQYLDEGHYFMLGSDTHGTEGLRIRLTGLENARRRAGDAVLDRLTIENPAQLLP